ncbi:MAG: threonine/serine exporter family protein [Blautia sp.]|jgi:uncharacterized membrane protein YjjB (DUF3815 family)
MEILLQAAASFGAVVTLGLIFCVPKRFLVYSGLAGALGWTTYIVVREICGNGMLVMFFAALLVALASHLFARSCKAPVTVFLITGILPLVPGVGVYRIVYYLLAGDNPMAGYYFIYTLQMAGMIAVAILIMDTVFKIIGQKRG